jgi:ParB/RepB/Spo0J family partition protein
MRASFEERDRAGYWSNRARAAESYTQHRNDPHRTLRRLERLRADLRKQERHHAEAVEKGWSSADRHARLVRDLTEEIEHWEQIVEKAKTEGVKCWGPDDFAPGDFVLYSGSWYQVARVNPKTLSIAWNLRLAPKQVMSLEDATFDGGRIGTRTADYTQVRARCPEAAMTAFLADGKVPGTKSAHGASEEQPASAVREALAARPKPKPKKSRSDPKPAKRVHVTCPVGGAEATLTWLNGNSRPHKDFAPVTVTAKDGERFHRAVWSRPLQAEIERVLGEHGYVCGKDDWAVFRDRSGFVRAIEPKREEPATVVDQPPAPEPAIEEAPAMVATATEPEEAPAETVQALAAVDTGEEQAPNAEAAAAPDAEPDRGNKTSSELRFLANHPVPKDTSGVSHSDYPLSANPPNKEPSDMTTTKAIETAETPATTKAAPAPAKHAATRKAPTKRVVEPTKVSKRREVVAEQAAETGAKVKTVQKRVPLDRIDRDPAQPREEFDRAKLEELAGSMKKLGQLQPVNVRYVPATRRYVLIMGERRWRAAQMAGLTELDAVVTHGVEEGDRETLAKQVAENVGRADMTAMEEAKSFKRLADDPYLYTVDEIAEMCGKSAAYVGWRIDLLRLCEPAQEALGKGHLPVGMAWYVSQLSLDNQMRFLGKYARGAFANDRDAEAFAKAARTEEQRRESQGSFFVLADEETSAKDVQDALPGAHDVPEEERERIIADRAKLTKKIDQLSTAGEILSELATADPEELATLLAGVSGGVAGHAMRVEHLRALTTKVIKNMREAQAIAAVRTGGIVLNPEAAA